MKLISISPFYQILLGPIEARDRSRARVGTGRESFSKGGGRAATSLSSPFLGARDPRFTLILILILTLPDLAYPVPSSLPIFGRVPGTILVLLWPCWPRVVAWDPCGVFLFEARISLDTECKGSRSDAASAPRRARASVDHPLLTGTWFSDGHG